MPGQQVHSLRLVSVPAILNGRQDPGAYPDSLVSKGIHWQGFSSSVFSLKHCVDAGAPWHKNKFFMSIPSSNAAVPHACSCTKFVGAYLQCAEVTERSELDRNNRAQHEFAKIIERKVN